MVAGVPVLGEDDVVETGGDGVDAGKNGVAVGDGQGAAVSVGIGQEVKLHVDDEESVGGAESDGREWVHGGRISRGIDRVRCVGKPSLHSHYFKEYV